MLPEEQEWIQVGNVAVGSVWFCRENGPPLTASIISLDGFVRWFFIPQSRLFFSVTSSACSFCRWSRSVAVRSDVRQNRRKVPKECPLQSGVDLVGVFAGNKPHVSVTDCHVPFVRGDAECVLHPNMHLCTVIERTERIPFIKGTRRETIVRNFRPNSNATTLFRPVRLIVAFVSIYRYERVNCWIN